MNPAFQPIAQAALPHLHAALEALKEPSQKLWDDHKIADATIDLAIGDLNRVARDLEHYSEGRNTPEFEHALAAFRAAFPADEGETTP